MASPIFLIDEEVALVNGANGHANGHRNGTDVHGFDESVFDLIWKFMADFNSRGSMPITMATTTH
ncbi:MAG: hypothetical protein R2867_12185 [Caldilineaceae bacterium]